jgi:hypothetical protein
MDYQNEVNLTVHMPIQQQSCIDNHHTVCAQGTSDPASEFSQQIWVHKGIERCLCFPIGKGKDRQFLSADLSSCVNDFRTKSSDKFSSQGRRTLDYLVADPISVDYSCSKSHHCSGCGALPRTNLSCETDYHKCLRPSKAEPGHQF